MRSKLLIFLIIIFLSTTNIVDSKSNIHYYVYPKDILPKYNEIDLYINNQKLNFEKNPHVIDGHLMVQARPIYESFGLKLSWDNKTKTLLGLKDNINLSLTIGDNIIKINNRKLFSKIEPYILDGHTMVPLRIIAESLGAKVHWDDLNKIVNINY